MTRGMVQSSLSMKCSTVSLIMHWFAGTKNVAKEMKKIAQGELKREGITWFTELSDKSIEGSSVLGNEKLMELLWHQH